MTLWEYYLQYTSGVLDGSKPCPAGITIEGTDDMARAASLLTQAEKLGMDGFVKACAAAEGVEIPQDVFDDYKPQEIEALLEQLPGAQEPQRDNAYAALLDCCALEDGLMQYLIEVLRTGDAAGFYRLARVTTRTDVKPEAFLAWLGSLEDRAEPEERECAQIMDGCLRRLVQEGRGEVAAALDLYGLPPGSAGAAEPARSHGGMVPDPLCGHLLPHPVPVGGQRRGISQIPQNKLNFNLIF